MRAMPGVSQLPASLASLAYRQSIEVRPDPDFHNDVTRLVSALAAIIDPDAPQGRTPSLSAEPGTRRRSRDGVDGLHVAAIALAAVALAVPALKHLRETPPPETRVEIVTPDTT